jgi:hypothetical protein
LYIPGTADAGSGITDFSRRAIAPLGKTKPVLLTGATGPGVIVIHVRLYPNARALLPLGVRCYAPVLFGSPDAGNAEKPTLGRILSLCISREFTRGCQIQMLASGSSAAIFRRSPNVRYATRRRLKSDIEIPAQSP